MSPANPVRSERKQPQWTVHGSSSLPLADCEDRSSTMSQEAPTAYRVLARKYRPETFAALIGQEALVRTLSNALEMKRLAHAFVLTGVRGIGKTSTARLLAKGLNCIGVNGSGKETLEPCGSCEPCTAIGAGRHVDVLEIDAASHTGVDDAREAGRLVPDVRRALYALAVVHLHVLCRDQQRVGVGHQSSKDRRRAPRVLVRSASSFEKGSRLRILCPRLWCSFFGGSGISGAGLVGFSGFTSWSTLISSGSPNPACSGRFPHSRPHTSHHTRQRIGPCLGSADAIVRVHLAVLKGGR